MASVEISHDEMQEASKTIGNYVGRTGAIRWWKPLNGPAVLQGEWIAGGTGARIWVDIPTITEVRE